MMAISNDSQLNADVVDATWQVRSDTVQIQPLTNPQHPQR